MLQLEPSVPVVVPLQVFLLDGHLAWNTERESKGHGGGTCGNTREVKEAGAPVCSKVKTWMLQHVRTHFTLALVKASDLPVHITALPASQMSQESVFTGKPLFDLTCI